MALFDLTCFDLDSLQTLPGKLHFELKSDGRSTEHGKNAEHSEVDGQVEDRAVSTWASSEHLGEEDQRDSYLATKDMDWDAKGETCAYGFALHYTFFVSIFVSIFVSLVCAIDASLIKILGPRDL